MRTSSSRSPGFPTSASTVTDQAGVGAGLYTIHIIDDDAPLGAALTAGLESRGYHTVYSNSATAGWTEARRHPPDLILCDINMPGENGHRFLEKLRQDPALANCQFVFMTGNPTFAHPRVGMDLGADDFLLKPFTLETLVTCVTARLRRKAISRREEADLIQELRASLHRWMPHEFFTPLTGIVGYAEMLDEDFASLSGAEVREAVHGILTSAQRLHRTLRNYVFTLDRLNPDSDAPFPVLSAATVARLFTRGAETAQVRHAARRKDLSVSIAATPLSAGAQELELLVEELLDNAFSFSADGTPVRLTARRKGANLELTVTDAGRGMTPQQLKALGAFHQFERPTFEQQGLGLGIFIVRQVVRRMGGQLQISSQPGKGSTFTALLPVYAEAGAKAAP